MIFEHSRRYPKQSGWAVVAKLLSDEVSQQREELERNGLGSLEVFS